MNETLKEMAGQEPKLPNLGEKDKGLYQFGLMLLSSVVAENFLDIPQLPADRHSKDGLFYSIPYLHDTQLWHSGNTRNLLVVWKIENRASFCPLRIDVEVTDEDNYSINVYDQSGERTVKKSLYMKEKGKFYTAIIHHDQQTLSELVNGGVVGV